MHAPKNARKPAQPLPPIEHSVGMQKASLLRTTLKSLVASKVRCATARQHGCIASSQPYVGPCRAHVWASNRTMQHVHPWTCPQEAALQDTPTSPRTDVPPLGKGHALQQQGPALRGRGDDLPALTGGQRGGAAMQPARMQRKQSSPAPEGGRGHTLCLLGCK